MPNLTLVAGIHGNETRPLSAIQDLGLKVVIGNPAAIAINKRFVEEDLNRCFGKPGTSLEHLRARDLRENILPKGPVLDFHTFSCKSEPFAVIVDRTYLPLAQSLGLRHVVIMAFDIKDGGSLIGDRGGVSVEMGHHDDALSFDRTQALIQGLGQLRPAEQVRVYEVFDILREPGDYINFQEHPGGFIPVLAGETAYSHYGLKARLVE